MPYEIRYKIPDLTGDKVHVAGPYDSFAVAEEHRRDIVGYAGVTECYMSEPPNVVAVMRYAKRDVKLTVNFSGDENGAQSEEPCAAEDGA